MLFKFEDMKKNPPKSAKKELRRVFDFIGLDMPENILDQAVEYSSFVNMRKMEMSGEINDYRMLPGDINDPNSYRTRKGKVGNHKEELSKKDIDYVNKEMGEKLDPIFGYKPN